jgi:hypothetical protein
MLSVSLLEDRSVPADLTVAAGGLVYTDSGFVQPFADWEGDLSISRSGSRLIVGAGEGAGPRVKVIDFVTGETEFDFFAFEETFRGGVRVRYSGEDDLVFVGPGPGGGPIVASYVLTPTGPTETSRQLYGNPDYRGGVSLDAFPGGLRRPDLTFGTGPVRLYLDLPEYTVADQTRIAESVAGHFAPLFDLVHVTTKQPLLPPSRYGTVRVRDLSYLSPTVIGAAPTTLLASFFSFPLEVWVDDDLRDWETVAHASTHELGHFLGLGHVDDPENLMFAFSVPGTQFSSAQYLSMRAYIKSAGF